MLCNRKRTTHAPAVKHRTHTYTHHKRWLLMSNVRCVLKPKMSILWLCWLHSKMITLSVVVRISSFLFPSFGTIRSDENLQVGEQQFRLITLSLLHHHRLGWMTKLSFVYSKNFKRFIRIGKNFKKFSTLGITCEELYRKFLAFHSLDHKPLLVMQHNWNAASVTYKIGLGQCNFQWWFAAPQ